MAKSTSRSHFEHGDGLMGLQTANAHFRDMVRNTRYYTLLPRSRMVNVAGPSGKTRHFAGSFHCWCERSLAWQYTVSFDESKRNDSLQSRDVMCLSIRMFFNFHRDIHFECAADGFTRSCCSRKCVLVHRPSHDQAPITQSMRAPCS